MAWQGITACTASVLMASMPMACTKRWYRYIVLVLLATSSVHAQLPRTATPTPSAPPVPTLTTSAPTIHFTYDPTHEPTESPSEAPTMTPSYDTDVPTSQPTHMPLVLSDNVIIGSVIMYLSSTLSAAGGLGGGALNVPILWLLFGFSFHTAVILSLCTLSGNYLMQVLINLPKRHPIVRSRPLIYWDVILVLLPAELGGANLGVILSDTFPETILIIMALLILMIALFTAYDKGVHQWAKETRAIEMKQRRLANGNSEEDTEGGGGGG